MQRLAFSVDEVASEVARELASCSQASPMRLDWPLASTYKQTDELVTTTTPNEHNLIDKLANVYATCHFKLTNSVE